MTEIDFSLDLSNRDKKSLGTIVALQTLGLEYSVALQYLITKNPNLIAEAIAYAYYGAEAGLSIYKNEAFPIARFVYDNSRKVVGRIKDMF